jgi:hypothetical protein
VPSPTGDGSVTCKTSPTTVNAFDIFTRQSTRVACPASGAVPESLASPRLWSPIISSCEKSSECLSSHEDDRNPIEGTSAIEGLTSSSNDEQPFENETSEGWRPDDVFEIGYVDNYGDWRCRFEGCKSKKVYERACDLRKHFSGHVRRYFCIEDGCKWAVTGFTSEKDLVRHSATHRPEFRCPMVDCDRTFSRAGMFFAHDASKTFLLAPVPSLTDETYRQHAASFQDCPSKHSQQLVQAPVPSYKSSRESSKQKYKRSITRSMRRPMDIRAKIRQHIL